MEVELTKLRHILAVARTRNFSRAAEELHITQPALSRSIASFEQSLGLKLFDRGRRGVVPTTVGALVIAEMETLVRSARDLRHNLQLYATGEAGRIAFGLGPLLASMFLPRLSQVVLRSRPRLQVKTSIKTTDQLLLELLDDRIEMIFSSNWQLDQSPDVVVDIIGQVELRLVVRGSHPLASQPRLQRRDLDAFPAASPVDVPAGGLSGRSGAFVCDNFHILRETVLGSDCVLLCSPQFVADDLEQGRLSLLNVVDFAPISSQISMTYRRGRTLSPAAAIIKSEIMTLLTPMHSREDQ